MSPHSPAVMHSGEVVIGLADVKVPILDYLFLLFEGSCVCLLCVCCIVYVLLGKGLVELGLNWLFWQRILFLFYAYYNRFMLVCNNVFRLFSSLVCIL
ncbi:hypothetical protein Tsubulata_039115 [Turnera subulata]|uniref:Transmembrane protein n=1 Tax=Turnera subulata TaxID=218843 RepID=A0A9Q0F8E8_9ROSI|nr:hypothetical protein Tsubulata_039115 [Turnera subulata]